MTGRTLHTVSHGKNIGYKGLNQKWLSVELVDLVFSDVTKIIIVIYTLASGLFQFRCHGQKWIDTLKSKVLGVLNSDIIIIKCIYICICL